MWKKSLITVATLILALALSACGTSAQNLATAEDVVFTTEAVAEAPAEATDAFMDTEEGTAYDNGTDYKEFGTTEATLNVAENASLADENAKLIYSGNLNVEATDFTAAQQELTRMVSEFGGYFEHTDAQLSTTGNYANYTIRIKREHFSEFLSAVSESSTCKITYQSTGVEDIGLQYYDVESHLEMLHEKLDRLNALWEQAESMEDIIALESAISQLEYEISSYTSQKNHYDNLIDYSTIYLTLNQVTVYSEPVEPTFGEKVGARFQFGISNLKDSFEDILLFFVENMFQILIFFLFNGLIVLIVVLIVKSAKKRHLPPPPSEPDAKK